MHVNSSMLNEALFDLGQDNGAIGLQAISKGSGTCSYTIPSNEGI